MSLPTQTTQLLQTARELVRGLPADAVLLLTETSLDWDEVARILAGIKVFVAAETAALTRPLRDRDEFEVIDMDFEPLPIQERLSNALLNAISGKHLKPGAHVVVLYNGIATLDDAPEPIDSVSVIHLGEHLERMTAQDLRVLGRASRWRSCGSSWTSRRRSAARAARASRSVRSSSSATPGGC